MKLFCSEYFRNILIKNDYLFETFFHDFDNTTKLDHPHVFTPQSHQPQQQKTPKHINTRKHQNTKSTRPCSSTRNKGPFLSRRLNNTSSKLKHSLSIMLIQGLGSTNVFPRKKDYASSSLWRRRKLTNSVRTIGIWAHLGASGETFASETRSSEFIL